MKIHNSQSQLVEPLIPREREITIYVCGITPYDITHIGHAFTYASIDVLIRYLELRGLKTRYVQNVTDIDDDILRKAKETGKDWRTLGNQCTVDFIVDMQNLNIRPPDHYPRATEVIEEIVRSVQKLVNIGRGYESGGSVYYSVKSDRGFGRLSKLGYDEMLPIANERGNKPDDPNKRDPLDFVLWQAQAPGEPAWESPWGPGRPGWHIECATMSTKYLGDTIDIHGGGADLLFPHHECEIAQVQPFLEEKPFVRYWLHTAMVRYQGEKMSKSLGNMVMVRDLLNDYSPDALRVYLGSQHYRDDWSYAEQDLKKAAKRADKFTEAVTANGGSENTLNAESAWAAFTSDMDNDLDTEGALNGMEVLADQILEAALAGREVGEAQEALRQFGSVFGLRMGNPDPEQQVVEGWEKHLKKVGE